MEKNRADGIQNPIATLVVLVLVLMGLRVAYVHGLDTDQFIEIIRTIAWPVVAIIALGSEKTWTLLNSVTDLELWGIKAKKAQQKPESSEEIVETGGTKQQNEEIEFRNLDQFLVQNTRSALFWFANQPSAVTQDAFLQTFAFTEPIQDDAGREKQVILGVLLHRGLIEFTRTKTIQITEKGRSYLRHLGLLPSLN